MRWDRISQLINSIEDDLLRQGYAYNHNSHFILNRRFQIFSL